jgi:hypothetical protein
MTSDPLFDRSRWAPLCYATIWIVLAGVVLIRAGLDRYLNDLSIGGASPGVLINIAVVMLGGLAIVIMPARLGALVGAVWAPFLLWMLWTCSYAPDKAVALRLYWQFLTLPAIFAMALVSTARGQHLQALLRLALWSLTIPVVIGVGEKLLFPAERVAGSFTHPNILATYLPSIIAILPWVYKFGTGSRPSLRLAGVAVAGAFAALLLLGTETRSAWAVVALVFVLACAMIDWRGFLVLPLAALALLLPQVQERLADVKEVQDVPSYMVTSGEVVLDSYSWRKRLWADGLADSEGQRLFGKGLAAFEVNSAGFFTLTGPDDPAWAAHSTYVQLLYEGGVIGVAAFLWIWAALLWFAWRQSRVGAPVLYAVIALILPQLLIGYSDNVLYYLAANWYCWALLGGFLGAGWRLMEDRRAAPPPPRTADASRVPQPTTA